MGVLDDAVYLLPLRRSAIDPDDDLGVYLNGLATWVSVVVVDGSPEPVRAAHARSWGGVVRHLTVGPPGPGENGKAAGVLVGLAATVAPLLVLADDDVRYDRDTLTGVVGALDGADLVRPQNVFRPRPWHARWDTARSLLNRALGADHPGTLALRRSALGPEGYDPRVLFENLELVRTVLARGGRVLDAPGTYVERRPPTVRRFAEQRVRQAYDSFAQPARLAVELALLPVAVASVAVARTAPTGAVHRASAAVVPVLALAAVALAEAGRRRSSGREHFPATAALWAPAWLAERAVCAWIALVLRVLGGVPYGGTRLHRAAHATAELRRGSGAWSLVGEAAHGQ